VRSVLSQNHLLWVTYVDPTEASNQYFSSFTQFVETKPSQLADKNLGLISGVEDAPMFKV
jgi:hypothetical protein